MEVIAQKRSKKELKKESKRLKREHKLNKKIDKKQLKEKDKDIKKVVIDLLPFLNVSEDGAFITKNGYIDIFQIGSKDLNTLNSEEIQRHTQEFSTFVRGYSDDLKIISMSFPVNTKVQQEHFRSKIENTNNRIYIKFLNKKLGELRALEELRKNKEFYLMVFYKNERDKREKEIYLNRKSRGSVELRELDLDKKVKILYKLNNQNSKI